MAVKHSLIQKGGMQAKGVWKKDREANIWAQERWKRRIKKATQWGTSYFPSFTNIVKVIKSRKLRWAGNVVRIEEDRSAFKILTSKPTGKRPLGKPRWELKEKYTMNVKKNRYRNEELG